MTDHVLGFGRVVQEYVYWAVVTFSIVSNSSVLVPIASSMS